MFKRILVATSCIIVLLFAVVFTSNSQKIDNRGQDFWITYLPNYHINKFSSNELLKYSDSIYIFIVAEEPTTVNLEYYDIQGNRYTETFEITNPDSIFVFGKPFNDFELLGFNDMAVEWKQNQNEVVSKMSFHLTSDKPITVYAHSQGNKSSDAFLVFPTPSLGNEYIVLTYKSDGFFISQAGWTPSEFAIVATTDSTNVTIKPSCPTYSNGLNVQRITLNRGEVYLVQARVNSSERENDLTGTEIISDAPIAVFAGHQRSTLPLEIFRNQDSPSRDFICEQIPPVSTWGKNVVVVPFPQPQFVQNYDIFRVLASKDSTNISINGTFVKRLNRGEFYEGSLDAFKWITATEPILVATYKSTSNTVGSSYLGDPFMMIIPPTEQFIRKCKIMNIQAYERDNTSLQSFKVYEENYLTVIVYKDNAGKVILDGQPIPFNQYVIQPNLDFAYATVKVEEGQHFLESTAPFGVLAYGYGPANSYGYVGGMYLEKITRSPEWFVEEKCFSTEVSIVAKEDESINSVIFKPYNSKLKFNLDSSNVPPTQIVKLKIESEDIYNDWFCFIQVDGDFKSLEQDIGKTIYVRGFTFRYPFGLPDKYYPLRLRYIPDTINTYKILIYNAALPHFEYKDLTQVEIISNLKFRLVTPLPKSIRYDTIDTLEFVLEDNPLPTDTVYIKIADDCYKGNFVAITFYRSECDPTEFTYDSFRGAKNLNFVGDAFISDSVLRLSPSAVNKVGAVWYKDLVPVVSGFKTEFAFRLKNGTNNTCKDNSLPGADGIAFVVQNFIPYAIGRSGGGIGYDGIPNSVAIEFDTFSNDSTQIENYFDPNGNHVAVQSNGKLTNTSKHTQQTTLGINKYILTLHNDVVYYASIIYNEKNKWLEIYLDTTKEFFDPVLRVEGFDLSELINLERGYRAWVGFTSATGCAMEDHDILYWHFCPNPPDPLRSVEDRYKQLTPIVSPNPADDKIVINLPALGYPTRYKVFDYFGKVVLNGSLDASQTVDIRNLTTGVYVIELTTSNKCYRLMFTIVR